MLIPPWGSLVAMDSVLQHIERSRIAGDHEAALLAINQLAAQDRVQALAAYLTCLGREHGSLLLENMGTVLRLHAPAAIHVLTAGERALTPMEALAFLRREAPTLLVGAFERWLEVIGTHPATPPEKAECSEVVTVLATLYASDLRSAADEATAATTETASPAPMPASPPLVSPPVSSASASSPASASAALVPHRTAAAVTRRKLLDLIFSSAQMLSHTQAQVLLSELESTHLPELAAHRHENDRDTRGDVSNGEAGTVSTEPQWARAQAMLLARLWRHGEALRLLVAAEADACDGIALRCVAL